MKLISGARTFKERFSLLPQIEDAPLRFLSRRLYAQRLHVHFSSSCPWLPSEHLILLRQPLFSLLSERSLCSDQTGY